MAHILVQQQTHRSPNITIHSSIASQKEPPIPMRHSVDDRLFLEESTELINFITRFASEPQMSKFNTQSVNSNGYASKSPVVFALTSPPSNTCVQVIESGNDDFDLNDFLYSNCDKIQPVPISSTEDLVSDETDNITTMTTTTTVIEPLSEHITTVIDEIKSSPAEDGLIEISPSVCSPDAPSERHFHRRRRRSSLTRNSVTLDEKSTVADALAKLDLNQQLPNETEPKVELKPPTEKENTDDIQTKSSEDEVPQETVVENEPAASVSRYRGRSTY